MTDAARDATPAPSPPAVDDKLNVIGSVADLAPTLKEAELRVLLELTRRAASNAHHTLRASSRDLATACKLGRPNVQHALDSLSKRGLITIRQGSATQSAAYQVNTLNTSKMVATQHSHPPASGWTRNDATLAMFDSQGGYFTEPPPTENKGLPAAAPSVDDLPRLTPILDRVLTSKISHHDKATLETFRAWLHGYMCKLGRDDRNQPTPHAHPPDLEIVAQFLAVAEPGRLGAMLDSLLLDRKTAYSYAWFVTVALQRIHGIAWTETKKARAALRVVKAGQRQAAVDAGAAADPQATLDLLNQIESIARIKKLR